MPNSKDDMKNSIVGEAVLAEARSNPSFKGQLKKILDNRITDNSNRKLAGLDGDDGLDDHMESGD